MLTIELNWTKWDMGSFPSKTITSPSKMWENRNRNYYLPAAVAISDAASCSIKKERDCKSHKKKKERQDRGNFSTRPYCELPRDTSPVGKMKMSTNTWEYQEGTKAQLLAHTLKGQLYLLRVSCSHNLAIWTNRVIYKIYFLKNSHQNSKCLFPVCCNICYPFI